ncbi:DNA polymerase III subunit [Gordonia Phage Zitch]|uniref:DNA polymerase III subunit n=1 Tax=Gordonia Phage Zitch TaxID=2743909 RepID=A0A7G3WHW6_9CAUD|nr:DNA polymerase III subunit [Gordonia Phage Zitch]QKY78527.1 DNA polymerase III subunit [Gordonia Phage Zitch]
MTLADMPLAAFDLETTGPDPRDAFVVTASIVTIDGAMTSVDEWLLDPGVEIPDGAAAIHGVTTERARAEGTDYRTGIDEISHVLGRLWRDGYLVVVMNAPYDYTIMTRECRRLDIPDFTVGPTIDPLVIDKALDRYRRGGRTLTDLAKVYEILQGEAHQSSGDCLTAARIAYRQLRAPALASIETTDELMALQRSWRAQQQDSLRAFWQGRGDERWQDVNSDWPVQLDWTTDAGMRG